MYEKSIGCCNLKEWKVTIHLACRTSQGECNVSILLCSGMNEFPSLILEYWLQCSNLPFQNFCAIMNIIDVTKQMIYSLFPVPTAWS